ncbi:MAG: glycine cleavage system aminomethyltransferase GcvT [Spirochaetota bacterium]
MSYNELVFNKQLSEVDPEVSRIVELEEQRQARKIIMIPSESICPSPVRQALGTVFTSIYSEGYPPRDMLQEDPEGLQDHERLLCHYRRYSDRRFYKGCEYANFMEALARRRAAEAFATKKNPPENIHVNVQPLSGAAANNSVYDAFVEHGDVVMGMSLMHGGHLTHGSEFNRSGKSYRIVSYEADPSTERLNYNKIMDLAQSHRPRMIIAGYTSYPWAPDWEKFREIADSVGAVLLADVAHPAGMIAAGVYPSPVDYADVITFTTHKTMFGPRGAVIMTTSRDHAERIDQAVFPGEQGGPHVNKFAAMAVAFQLARTQEFKKIQQQTVNNARTLSGILQDQGLKLAYGGTDTHLFVIDLKSISTRSGYRLLGEIGARVLDLCGIVANKNTIPGDIETAGATGVRMGTPWITQRGITEEQLQELGGLIADILKNIDPFTYRGLTGDLPRGKISLQVLKDCAQKSEALAQQLFCEKKPGPLSYPYHPVRSIPNRETDQNNTSILLVKGSRSLQFMEEISTSKISCLRQGDSTKTFFFNREGVLICTGLVMRLGPPECLSPRFAVLCSADKLEELKEWMRGLSDGYTAFNDDDIFMKVEGPVVVKDLAETDQEEKEKMKTLLEKTSSTNHTFQDLSVKEEKKDCSALYQKYPQYFDMTKPFFIGQNYLERNAGTGRPRNYASKKSFQYKKSPGEAKKGFLFQEHRKLNASMIDFAGWKMPVRYQGIIDEHRAVREAAGVFDISHMGVLEISGEYATSFLDTIASNYVLWIQPGQSQYSYLLDPEGNVIDDIMVYRLEKNRYILVVNAANNDKDLSWMKAVNSGEYIIDTQFPHKEPLGKAHIQDLRDPSAGHRGRINLALQGPASLGLLKRISSPGAAGKLQRLQKTEFIEVAIADMDVLVSRTGFTGEEYGYELLVYPSRAPELWNTLLGEGKPLGVKPVGLGARDSLRTEAGLPLYGHELAGPHNISPIEAGFAPYVKFHKPYFIGRKALLERMDSFDMEIARFRMNEKGVKPAKMGDPVASKRTQKVIGSVTSCAVNGEGIQVGMAYVNSRFAREGTDIAVVPLPHHAGHKGISVHEARPGDRLPLHVNTTVVARFPENGNF